MDQLLSDECHLQFFAALEFDPDLSFPDFKPREFFEKEATFKNILNITDASFLERIHKIYRFTYLKDSAFTQTLDDTTVGWFSSYHMMNLTELITGFTASRDLRFTLVRKLSDAMFVGYKFLNELC